MVKIVLPFIFSFISSISIAQNVGIGTTTPLARLHVMDSNVVFSGPAVVPITTSFVPGVEGAGARMSWFPQKAAFRAGYVNSNGWDAVFTGRFSFAAGINTASLGEAAFASGNGSQAIGNNSTAMGFNALAFGNNSVALGNNPFTQGENSFGTGFQNRATGYSSAVFGNNNEAAGSASFATGYFNKASGYLSASFGEQNKAKSDVSFVIGRYNDTTAISSLFEIGYGTADNLRRNAITVINTGFTGIHTINPQAGLHVDRQQVVFTAAGDVPAVAGNTAIAGAGRRMMWYPDKAAFRVGYAGGSDWDKDNVGKYSFAAGNRSVGLGESSTALGASIANKSFSTALGNAFADGDMSAALGQGHAFGQYSLAVGNGYSVGEYSVAIGKSVISKAFGSVSLGAYGDLTDNSSETEFGAALTDRIFQLANGNESQSKNAITVLRNGKMGIGTVTPRSMIDIRGENNWDLQNTEGDFRIGNDQYRIKMGVALGGGGAGAATIRAAGGIERLNLGANNINIITLNGVGANVGIGTENPSQKLQVIGNILASGTITPSDLRYKKDIRPVQHPLEKIQLLGGYTYRYKTTEFPFMGFEDTEQLGLIAQEVEKVFPQLVVTGSDGYKAVDYVKLVPVLLEGIKELVKENKKQQQQIDELLKMMQQVINK